MDINSNIPKPDFSKSIEKERQMRQLKSKKIKQNPKRKCINKTMESVAVQILASLIN